MREEGARREGKVGGVRGDNVARGKGEDEEGGPAGGRDGERESLRERAQFGR